MSYDPESKTVEKEKEPKRRRFRRLLLFLAVAGPGIITANVDNDAGGITTYSVSGAHFGYELLWAFVPIIVALTVVQEMCSRMGVVTGKGLSDLIREQFGAKTTFYFMIALVITNIGNSASNFAGIAASMEIFGVSKYISVPASAVFVWSLVVKGTYRSVEKIFLVACLFYISYVISGILARPDWSEVSRGFIPSFNFQNSYLTMLIGLIGTTIAPWMQFYQQASIVEKGIKVEHYRYAQLDVIFGSIVVHLIAFFIVVCCAATLFQNKIVIETAKDAALGLQPLAGNYCSWLFAFGLLNASLFASSILPLSTAYTVCEGMGWEVGVDKKRYEAPQFYGLYEMIIAIGMGITLIPKMPLIPIMLISQVVNGILLPFVLICMLRLINNQKLMGAYTNSKLYNAIAWTTTVVMLALTVGLVITTIF